MDGRGRQQPAAEMRTAEAGAAAADMLAAEVGTAATATAAVTTANLTMEIGRGPRGRRRRILRWG